jgi:hypothetical protein
MGHRLSAPRVLSGIDRGAAYGPSGAKPPPLGAGDGQDLVAQQPNVLNVPVDVVDKEVATAGSAARADRATTTTKRRIVFSCRGWVDWGVAPIFTEVSPLWQWCDRLLPLVLCALSHGRRRRGPPPVSLSREEQGRRPT